MEEKVRAAGNGNKVHLKESLCLCHGICGNLVLMAGMGKAEETGQLWNLVGRVIGDGEKGGGEWTEIQEFGNYGLLSGLAGVGIAVYAERGKGRGCCV